MMPDIRVAMVVLWILLAITPANAGSSNAYRVRLAVGRTQSISAAKAKQIVLGDSSIAKAQLARATGRIVVTGLTPGITNLDVTRTDGKQIRYLLRILQNDPEIVRNDLAEAFTAFPEIKLRTIGEKVMVEGTASRPSVYETVQQVLKGYPDVINVVQKPDVALQRMVALEAILVEVSTSRAKELGISWPDSVGVEAVWNGSQPLPGNGGLVGTITLASTLSMAIKMLSQKGSARLRSNPTLVAKHGTESSFRVGGEIPVAAVNKLGQTTVSWKNYGVELRFTPYIDSASNVSLKLVANVSQLDYTNAIETSEGTIPALKSRSTEGSVDLAEGEALVVAELFNESQGKSVSQVPFLGSFPIIGEAFRSRRLQHEESRTYLVVIPKVILPGSIRRAAAEQAVEIFPQAETATSGRVVEMFP